MEEQTNKRLKKVNDEVLTWLGILIFTHLFNPYFCVILFLFYFYLFLFYPFVLDDGCPPSRARSDGGGGGGHLSVSKPRTCAASLSLLAALVQLRHISRDYEMTAPSLSKHF